MKDHFQSGKHSGRTIINLFFMKYLDVMKKKTYFVYILTNNYHNVFYTGVTNDVVQRVFEHKAKRNRGFTHYYNVFKLVYFEEFAWVEDALHREKQIKKYRRQWKIKMITEMNPNWDDLSADWYDQKEFDLYLR